jgi:FkbM family methyltransferase
MRSNSKKKAQTIHSLTYPPEVLSKVIRSVLEKTLINLSKRHASLYRQIAVYSFDYISNQIAIDGVYELDDLTILFDWLKKFDSDGVFSGAAIDIGANIGNHSLYFSDFYRSVYSFEVNPQPFELLRLNTRLSNNIKCYNFGISSCEKISYLKVNPINIGGGSVDHHLKGSSLKCNLKPLDALSPSLIEEPIKLIKLDIEGHEYEALCGAEKIITKQNPLILFEQQPADIVSGSSRSLDLLRSFGYQSFAVIEKKYSIERKNDGLSLTEFTVNAIFRMVCGQKRIIRTVNELRSKYYPFIIAIPSWMKVEI